MTEELSRSLREFQDYVDDVIRANHQTFGDALARVMRVLQTPSPMGEFVSKALPTVDFESWHSAALSSAGGMGGRGELSWPSSKEERLATQLEVLRRADSGTLDLWGFCHTFLDAGTKYDDMVHSFANHVVRPFARDLVRYLHSQVPQLERAPSLPAGVAFVDPSRIAQLNKNRGSRDIEKLLRLCEELNICYRNECYFAVAMLARAVLDHVPPFFGHRTFAEVVANYAWGRSRKDAIEHLENAARKVADVHLHANASRSFGLPNQAQVNFGPSLDLLLAEVASLLQQPPAKVPQSAHRMPSG